MLSVKSPLCLSSLKSTLEDNVDVNTAQYCWCHKATLQLVSTLSSQQFQVEDGDLCK